MPYLIENSDEPNPKIYTLKLGLNTIGRELDNSIVILDKSLSRHHAKLEVTEQEVIITDLDSLNHTFVNGQQIEQCQLKNGDVIRYGSVVYKFLQTPSGVTSKQPRDSTENWSIISRLSPEETRLNLQSLLQSENLPEKGQGKKGTTIIKIPPKEGSERTVDKLKILLEVSKELCSPQNSEKLLDKILDLLFQIMEVDRGAILMVNPHTKDLEAKALKFRAGITYQEDFYSKTIIQFVQKHGDAILTADALSDSRFQESFSILKQAIHASLCVPLKPREEIIGILYVDNLSLTNIYSQEDLEFLMSLANQAAIAIENAQLYQQIQAEAVMRTKLERFFPKAIRKKLQEKEQWDIANLEVTILFADISNYTALSATMEPKEVIEMLNEYFTIMVEEIIFPHEGTLEKYVGDALLACWGAPYQHPDDAERAVRAAIAMQQAVCRLNQKWKQERDLEIDIHIGLNTGKVAAGNIGSRQLIQYAVIGDTTNVTSRICSVAEAGEILLSQSTFNKLNNGSFRLEKRPLVSVKGKEQPLQLYQVLWNQMDPNQLNSI